MRIFKNKHRTCKDCRYFVKECVNGCTNKKIIKKNLTYTYWFVGEINKACKYFKK